MRRLFLSLLLACAALSACQYLTRAERPQKYLVFTESDEAEKVLVQNADRFGTLDVAVPLPQLDALVIEMTPSQAEEITKQAGVLVVSADQEIQLIVPTDVIDINAEVETIRKNLGLQAEEVIPPGVDRLDAPAAWAKNYTGKGAKVCVVDTGVDGDHEDLRGAVVNGADFSGSGKKKGEDDHMHGTHVAGTIAARKNGVGVVGVAPEASIYSAKVLSARGSGSSATVAAGIDWCVGEGVDVISMSLGSAHRDAGIERATTIAREKGIVVVAASGNSDGPVGYPAANPGVLAIGALGSHPQKPDPKNDADSRAFFSNYGPQLFVAAPGVNVLSTKMGGGYVEASGTSMACPHVAGLAALLRGKKNFSPGEVEDLLSRASTSLSKKGAVRDDYFGYGVPTMGAALARLERRVDP